MCRRLSQYQWVDTSIYPWAFERGYVCPSFQPSVCLSVSSIRKPSVTQHKNQSYTFQHSRINTHHTQRIKKDSCMPMIICQTILHFLLYRRIRLQHSFEVTENKTQTMNYYGWNKNVPVLNGPVIDYQI